MSDIKNKHILFASAAMLPNNFAHGINIIKTAEALSTHGIHITLLSRKNTNFSQKAQQSLRKDESCLFTNKTNWVSIEGKWWRFFYKLLCHLISKRYDGVYTREPWIAFIASLFYKHIGWHAHGRLTGIKLVSRIKTLMVRYGRFRIFVVSEGMKQYYMEKYKVPQKKMTVIRNGVSIKNFKRRLSKKETRQFLGLSNDRFICVYAGNLYKGRGIDIILSIANILSDVQFLIVGGEPESIHNLKPISPSNVIFIGQVPHNDIPPYLWAADLLLMPYQQHVNIAGNKTGHGASILGPIKTYEYMASGTTIISSDLPFVHEVLTTDDCIFVEADNPDKWAAAIKKAMKNNYDTFGKRASERAKAYDISKTTKQIIFGVFHKTPEIDNR